MASSNDKSGDATEHTEEPQLAELLNQEAANISNIELKVTRTQLIAYTYEFKGNEYHPRKYKSSCNQKLQTNIA